MPARLGGQDQRGIVIQPPALKRFGRAGEDDDRPARDPSHFAQTRFKVRPLMHGGGGHGRVELAIREG
jgi:hypothetical protein